MNGIDFALIVALAFAFLHIFMLRGRVGALERRVRALVKGTVS